MSAPEQQPSAGQNPGQPHGSMEHHREMAERGVTRMQMDHGATGEMSAEDRHKMQHEHHQQTLWIYLTIVLLGFWLLISPFTFGHANPSLAGDRVADVTAVRNLAPIEVRGLRMLWSDIVSGALLVVLGFLSLSPRRVWAPWAACVVGLWLLLAPLVFWAPTAAAYANDTLVGILVIALTILVPGMPGMMLIMKMGPETPPGWTYNPSSWLQRAPVIALAWVGFFGARYLSAYQLGYIDSVWDPFFGTGTEVILDSEVSLAWPISDAGLGAVAYTLEALMGYMGGTSRWRTMPWMVLLFGILVVPLGLVSIGLVIMQPVAVGTWCTICLLTAAAMLAMIPLTLDEVTAMIQFVVKRVRDSGQSFWRTLILGDTIEEGDDDTRSPDFLAPASQSVPAMVWGVTLPWNLVLATAVGLWLLASPQLAGMQSPVKDSTHLVGAAIACVAVIAMAEVTRAARFLNIPLGLWIVASPFLLGGATMGVAVWGTAAAGLVVVALSLPRGSIREHYGGWDRYVV